MLPLALADRVLQQLDLELDPNAAPTQPSVCAHKKAPRLQGFSE
jgi:hypothetical protein